MANALANMVGARLKVFTDFLAIATVAGQSSRGLVGEFGWPNNESVPLWNVLANFYYSKADHANLLTTTWASGRGWGLGYNIGQWVNSAGGGDVNTAQSNTPPAEQHPTVYGVVRGTNMAGGDFGASTGNAFTNANVGTYGTDWVYPSLADLQFVYARGARLIRLPFLWERLQPTTGAALNATELGRIQTVLTNANTVGLAVLLDMHNYARYMYDNAGTKIILLLDPNTTGISTTPDANGEGRIGTNLYQDVWGRISDAVASGYPALYAYDLMNEPHNLPASSGTFTGTTMYAWEATTQAWVPGDGSTTLSRNTTTFHDGISSLQLTKTGITIGAYVNLRTDDGGQRLLDPGTGNFLSVWVFCPAGSTGWQARCEWQNGSFAWQQGQWIALTANAWNYVQSDFTSAGIVSPNAYAVQIETNSAQATSHTFEIDTFRRGTVASAALPYQTWENITQAMVTYLRGTKGDMTTVVVPGHGWNVGGWEHTTKWITEPGTISGGAINYANHHYETHHYWDPDDSGVYSATYAASSANATSGGFADDGDLVGPVISSVVATVI